MPIVRDARRISDALNAPRYPKDAQCECDLAHRSMPESNCVWRMSPMRVRDMLVLNMEDGLFPRSHLLGPSSSGLLSRAIRWKRHFVPRGPRHRWTGSSIVPCRSNGRASGTKASCLLRALTCTILSIFCGSRPNTSRRFGRVSWHWLLHILLLQAAWRPYTRDHVFVPTETTAASPLLRGDPLPCMHCASVHMCR